MQAKQMTDEEKKKVLKAIYANPKAKKNFELLKSILKGDNSLAHKEQNHKPNQR